MTEFSVFRVVSITSIGAFLDWGQEKDLFLPRNEQSHPIEIGDEVMVAIYSDREGRPCSTMKLERFADKNTSELKPEQKVNLVIYDETELGFKALIDKKFSGVLYKNEVFKNFNYLDEAAGFIKKVREDGKVDLQLVPFGNKGADELGLRIIEALEEHNGFLEITDKTEPETIYKMFQVSKKKFKMALGGLYKKRLIEITEKGIRLT